MEWTAISAAKTAASEKANPEERASAADAVRARVRARLGGRSSRVVLHMDAARPVDFAARSLPSEWAWLRDGERILHFYSQSADLGPDGYRGMDLLSPAWHYLDLTPAGRGEWYPSLRYEE